MGAAEEFIHAEEFTDKFGDLASLATMSLEMKPFDLANTMTTWWDPYQVVFESLGPLDIAKKENTINKTIGRSGDVIESINAAATAAKTQLVSALSAKIKDVSDKASQEIHKAKEESIVDSTLSNLNTIIESVAKQSEVGTAAIDNKVKADIQHIMQRTKDVLDQLVVTSAPGTPEIKLPEWNKDEYSQWLKVVGEAAMRPLTSFRVGGQPESSFSVGGVGSSSFSTSGRITRESNIPQPTVPIPVPTPFADVTWRKRAETIPIPPILHDIVSVVDGKMLIHGGGSYRTDVGDYFVTGSPGSNVTGVMHFEDEKGARDQAKIMADNGLSVNVRKNNPDGGSSLLAQFSASSRSERSPGDSDAARSYAAKRGLSGVVRSTPGTGASVDSHIS